MSYMRAAIQALDAYVPGEQPRDQGWVKLNTNENPYPPSPAAVAAGARALETAHLYPDPLCTELCATAARVYGLAPAQVFAGNGSDEVLNLLVRMTAAEGALVASFRPSYTLYPTLAAIQGATYRAWDFDGAYRLPETPPVSGAAIVFLPNPNSPSATIVPLETIRDLCRAATGLVVVDEAYADFAQENALGLLGEFDNLVITRSFSKSYALAGLRVGLALAAPEVIDALLKIKDSYNLDAVAQAAATAALADEAYLSKTVATILATRDRLCAGLDAQGFEVYPSQANFVLARVPSDRGPGAREVYEALKARRILVRYFDAPRLDDCLRITVGTDAQTDQLLDALQEIIAKK